MPPFVECTYGPCETIAGGTTYEFRRDKYGRHVAMVHKLEDVVQLTSVVHYRVVDDIPGDLTAKQDEVSTDDPDEFFGSLERKPEGTGIGKPTAAEIAAAAADRKKADEDRLAAEQAETARLNAELDKLLQAEKEAEERRKADEAANAKPKNPELEAKGKDLTRIHGIGKATAEKLQGLGIDTVRKVADLDAAMIAMVEQQLNLGGRVARDKWVENAKALVGEDEAAAAAEGNQAPGQGE